MSIEKTHEKFTELVLENKRLADKLAEIKKKRKLLQRANWSLTIKSTEQQMIIDHLHTELWLARGGFNNQM